MKTTCLILLALLAAVTARATSYPIAISHSGSYEATESQNGRKIVSDSGGIYHAVYQANTGTHWVEYVYSLDPVGYRWSSPAPVTGSQPASNPALAIDLNDTLHLVWSDGTSILYSNAPAQSGGNWTPPINLCPSMQSTGSISPSIDCDANGAIHIVWQEVDATYPSADEIYYVSSTNGGLTFSTPVNLTNTIDESTNPCVACPCDWTQGSVHVVWDERWGTYTRIQHIADSGQGWTTPVLVNDNVLYGERSCILVDGKDNCHAVFSQRNHFDVCFNSGYKTPGGLWQFGTADGVAGTQASAGNPNPTLTLDGAGLLRLAWHDDDQSGTSTRTLFYTYRDLSKTDGWADVTTTDLHDRNDPSFVYKNGADRGGYILCTKITSPGATTIEAVVLPPMTIENGPTPATVKRGTTLSWQATLDNLSFGKQHAQLVLQVKRGFYPFHFRLYNIPALPSGSYTGLVQVPVPPNIQTGTYKCALLVSHSSQKKFWDGDSFLLSIIP